MAHISHTDTVTDPVPGHPSAEARHKLMWGDKAKIHLDILQRTYFYFLPEVQQAYRRLTCRVLYPSMHRPCGLHSKTERQQVT